MVDDYAIIRVETLNNLIMNKVYLNQHDNKIWQGDNGKWYTYIGTGKDRKLIKRASKIGIENYICQYYKDRQDNPLLNELFARWIDRKLESNEICKGTYDRYKCDWDRFVTGHEIETKHIGDIVEDDLDIFVRQAVSSKNYTHKAYSGLRTILTGVFKYAKRYHMTNISITAFFQDLDISKRVFKPKIPGDAEVFTEEETTILLQYLYSNPTIENLSLIFAFQTGVRCGELAAIKFSDIDRDILHIQRQEVICKSEIDGVQTHKVVNYTKTEKGNRYIYLPNGSQQVINCVRWINKDCEFMFAKNGTRIQKTAYNRYLSNACKAVDIKPRTMHKIRRTYGTTLIDNNVEDSLIMSQMGHTNIDTTRKYYYYANKDDSYKKEQINNSIIF